MTMPQFIHLLESRRLLSAGDLDPTFGDDGIASQRNLVYTVVHDSVLLPNDRLLVAGGRFMENEISLQYLLQRFNADGSPDTSFGTQGRVMGQFVSGIGTRIYDIALQSNGKILAFGENAGVGADRDQFIVARFNADGSLDDTFSDDGYLIIPNFTFHGAVQDDGKVLVVSEDKLFRFLDDGTPDESFGIGGQVNNVLGEGGTLSVVLQLSDGKLLVGGRRSNPNVFSFGLARLNTDGSPDTSFVDSGLVDTTVNSGAGVKDLLELPDGKIVAAGAGIGAFVAVRYSANGAVDSTFGDAGQSIVAFGQTLDLSRAILAPDGKIYLAARFGVAVARLNPDGTFDDSFGRVYGNGTHFTGAELQSNGRLVITGDAAVLDPLSDEQNYFYDVVLIGLQTSGSSASPVTLSAGRLDLQGSADDDLILVQRESPQHLEATINGIGRVFDAIDVTTIVASGGDGNDQLSMSRFIDQPCVLSGGNGNDKITGGSNNDTLSGNAGNDSLDGRDGADQLNGNGGKDKLRGMGGADRLYGGAGNDYLEGGGGQDKLRGDAGTDLLVGNAGDDRFFTVDSNTDTLRGDGGNDFGDVDLIDDLTSVATV